jgi:hypothetical protein
MSAYDPKRTLVAERPASFPAMELNLKIAVAVGGVVRAATGDSVAQRDSYLALALGLLARADGEPDPEKRAGFEALAASYRRMAEQAPHEGDPIIDVEVPIEETKPPEK